MNQLFGLQHRIRVGSAVHSVLFHCYSCFVKGGPPEGFASTPKVERYQAPCYLAAAKVGIIFHMGNFLVKKTREFYIFHAIFLVIPRNIFNFAASFYLNKASIHQIEK